jgi:hypothetical protein
MMRVIVCVCLVLMVSCGDKMPDNVMGPAKMQAVLWDKMQADEMADYYVTTDSTWNNPQKRQQLYRAVYQVHNITKEQFETSYNWYLTHPSKLKAILDSLQSFGERKQNVQPDTLKNERPFFDSNRKKRVMES